MVDWNQRCRATGIYLRLSAIAHLETLQLPPYTIWTSGTLWEIAFAVVHCTVGDIMIAAILAGRYWPWPRSDWKQAAALTTIFGVSYTAYSEWFNVYLRHAWAYSSACRWCALAT
jgi:hypothetical protein